MSSSHIHVVATLTSKGQVTIPLAVRERLGLKSGDRVVFETTEDGASITPAADFLAMAGSVPLPKGASDAEFSEVRETTRRSRLTR